MSYQLWTLVDVNRSSCLWNKIFFPSACARNNIISLLFEFAIFREGLDHPEPTQIPTTCECSIEERKPDRNWISIKKVRQSPEMSILTYYSCTWPSTTNLDAVEISMCLLHGISRILKLVLIDIHQYLLIHKPGSWRKWAHTVITYMNLLRYVSRLSRCPPRAERQGLGMRTRGETSNQGLSADGNSGPRSWRSGLRRTLGTDVMPLCLIELVLLLDIRGLRKRLEPPGRVLATVPWRQGRVYRDAAPVCVTEMS